MTTKTCLYQITNVRLPRGSLVIDSVQNKILLCDLGFTLIAGYCIENYILEYCLYENLALTEEQLNSLKDYNIFICPLCEPGFEAAPSCQNRSVNRECLPFPTNC